MSTPRLFHRLHQTGWEFWVPLPVIAALFWLMGNVLTMQLLSRPNESVNKLQAAPQSDMVLSMSILSIHAEIDRLRGVSTVAIRPIDPTSQPLKYTFSVTQTHQIEAAIAQKLNISPDNVRQIISYQLKE